MSYHNEFILAGSSDSVHRLIRGRRRPTATDAVGRDDLGDSSRETPITAR